MADFIVGLLIGGIGGLLVGIFCGYFYAVHSKAYEEYDEMRREYKEAKERVRKSIDKSRERAS